MRLVLITILCMMFPLLTAADTAPPYQKKDALKFKATNDCPRCNLGGLMLNHTVGTQHAQANLKQANLSSSYFEKGNLSYANLEGANMSKIDLAEGNLSGANLKNTNLSGATLSDANLSHTDLTTTDLAGADLDRANLSQTKISPEQLKTLGSSCKMILPNGIKKSCSP